MLMIGLRIIEMRTMLMIGLGDKTGHIFWQG